MTIPGRVHHGVVVLEGGSPLPEGMAVTVSAAIVAGCESAGQARRVSLPLVPSKHPGSRPLTAERIAELLEDDDVLARR